MIFITALLAFKVYSMIIPIANTYSYPSNICKCSQFTTQQTCQVATYCQWNNNQCNNISCSSAYTATMCQLVNVNDNSNRCVWHNYTCQVFTKCSDYSSPFQQFDCFAAGCYCSTIPCNCGNLQATTCSSITTPSSCSVSLQGNRYCIWSNSGCRLPNNCNEVSLSICPLQKLQQLCTGDLFRCSDINCSAYSTPILCLPFYTIQNGQQYYITCAWMNSRCVNVDITTQSNSNCLLYSMYTYTYNPTTSSCQSCSSLLNPTPSQNSTSNSTGTQTNSTSPSGNVNSTSSSNSTTQSNSTSQSTNSTNQNSTNTTTSNNTTTTNSTTNSSSSTNSTTGSNTTTSTTTSNTTTSNTTTSNTTTSNTTTSNTTTASSNTSLYTVQQIFQSIDNVILSQIAEQNKNLTNQFGYILATVSILIII